MTRHEIDKKKKITAIRIKKNIGRGLGESRVLFNRLIVSVRGGGLEEWVVMTG